MRRISSKSNHTLPILPDWALPIRQGNLHDLRALRYTLDSVIQERNEPFSPALHIRQPICI